MNTPGPNGNQSEGLVARADSISPLDQSYRVQWHLEQALEWFVAVDELNAARTLQGVLENLGNQRLSLVDQIIEAAEQQQAQALVEGR